MIKLIEKQKIIITYFQKGKSQRQIAREMDLNRRTVAKYVKGYETKKTQLADSKENTNQEVLIADIVEDPKYDTSNRKKVKLTEEIIDRIKFYLRENETKRAEGKTKQQKKKIDIHEALKEEGFDIGYTTTCNAWSSPDNPDTQLRHFEHFFIFLRTIIAERGMQSFSIIKYFDVFENIPLGFSSSLISILINQFHL